ncbi:unnamed protein product, partial [Prorocentrum cordatum]
VLLSAHIDDIGQEVTADSEAEVVQLLGDSARDLKAEMEQDLDMVLAGSKGTFLGSTVALTERAQEALRSLGLPERAGPRRARRSGAAAMRHLGVDFRAGRRARPRGARAGKSAGVVHRAGPVRKTRVRLGKARLRKALRAVAQVAGCRRIWHTAILPSARWGGEVTGFADSEVQELRSRAKRHYGHPHISSDIFGALQPKLDPLAGTVSMGVVRYAEEWWRTTDQRQANGRVLSAKDLRSAFDVASQDLDKDLPEAGPIGAMLRSLKWAGWEAKHATSFISPTLSELCVLSIGPKEIGMYFELDVLATTTARADVAARSRHALADDHPGIWWEGLRAVVENKYVTALTRHVVTSLAGGTYMTRQVAHQWGYLIAPACPRCGVTDTPAHRALGCVCFE